MDSTLSHSKLVERYALFFDRPEMRLRFLNNTLAQQTASRERADALLSRFRFLKAGRLYEYLLRIWLYQLIFSELRKLQSGSSDSSVGRGIKKFLHGAPLSARLLFRCYQLRRPLAVVGALVMCVALYGLYNGLAWSARQAGDYLAARAGDRSTSESSGAGAAYAQTVAEALPDYKPAKVWLVEQQDGFERYSNGARILRDFETSNRARGYQVYREGAATEKATLSSEPVGIVYHTSESDMLPFTPDNNASIESRSRGLLEFVRKNRSYNYLVDRFGQIYRIVRDEDAANHAGNSVWAGEGGTFVGLNDSFIGVCFESSMEAGEGGERLTEAQLVAGRLLTQVLRSRYQIDDRNCVAHGLVSVNPSNMRILYHHDWAQGFPFAAFGLSDKYAVSPASVSEFGFTYDDEVVAKLGGALWPGVARAEDEFRSRAERAGAGVAELRERMKEAFRERMESQRRARLASGAGD